MSKRPVRISFVRELPDPLHGLHCRRWVHMIEQRRRTGESLVPHELFRIDATVRLAEGDVSLAGDGA
jgi:hypothetical protein